MPFCARYRFIMLPALEISDGEEFTVCIPSFPPAIVTLGANAHPSGKWTTIRMKGFQTEEEARRQGQRLGNVLSVAGATTRLGIDIGFSRSTLRFSEAIHAAVAKETGRQLRAETHGLMVYEENTVSIMGMDARGSSLLTTKAFVERLTEWVDKTDVMSERQRNCAALLNDSFFVPQTEGQFVLRVSAVEALCDQSDVGSDYQSAISSIESYLVEQPFAEDVRESLTRSFAFLKKQSLRQSYMAKFRKLLSEKEAKSFDALYQKRSKLVHDGLGRGELNEAANEAMDLAAALLAAELRLAAQTSRGK